MNRDTHKIQERIEEIKANDVISRTQAKFNFKQFLKIIGKIEVSIDNQSIKSKICVNKGQEYSLSPENINRNEEQSSNDIQQSFHIEGNDENLKKEEQKENFNGARIISDPQQNPEKAENIK